MCISLAAIIVCIHYLCLLALCSRYLAFCLAEPLPWAPVMYFFFLALVFTLSDSLFPEELFLKTMPPSKMSVKLSDMYKWGLCYELMVEQSNTCECHCDAILVASLNNIIVTDATACLCYIFYTTLVCTLDVVAKWEESI